MKPGNKISTYNVDFMHYASQLDWGNSVLCYLSQIRYSLVVILELNSVSEIQYKNVMMIDDEKYQQE